ncbi:hypothetical protein ABEB36_006800 [Hypothenemus hampei]|uniref:Uncharacterized protein n=1 Tax=Hypothenemus hampei TaxID=57062 RepID=A0ABD1ESA5_HYPHA
MSQHSVLMNTSVFLSKYKENVISDEKSSFSIGSCQPISSYVVKNACVNLKSTFSMPSNSYNEYSKEAHENLVSISNNMSTMLRETFSGIDSICQKVRMCLLEANAITKSPKLEQDTSHSPVQTLIDLIEDLEEEKEEQSPEIIKIEQPKELVGPSPFFTVLNAKNQLVGVNPIRSMVSKLSLSTKCTADNFQKTMENVEKLPDYEAVLASLVKNVNEDIDKYYKKMGIDMKEKKKAQKTFKTRSGAHKSSRPKSTPPPRNRRMKPVEEIFKDQETFDRENHISKCDFVCTEKFNISHADVYRKKAITDLHQRMITQLEANDSLIFFQNLIKKNRKFLKSEMPKTAILDDNDHESIKSSLNYFLPSKRQKQSAGDLKQKYKDSLWFKQVNKHDVKHSKKSTKRRIPKLNSILSEKMVPRTYSQKMDSRKSSQSSCKCKITVKNEQPLSESEKCKMHWMRAKYSQLKQRKLKYLDILDDISKDDLVPLKAEYPRRDEIPASTGYVKDTYLYKLLHGKGKENKRAWSELLESPERKSESDSNREEVVQTLSKYIFSELDPPDADKNVFTVMPVHMFYDNARGKLPKVPLLPMKENKEILKKAEWAKDIPKKPKPSKVVYDPILRKIDKEIRLVNAKHESRSFLSPQGIPKQPSSNSLSPRNYVTDIDVRRKIEKELESQLGVQQKNEQDKKIWENKYGKSVGQKLLNFIEKQPHPYQPSVPKHALPNKKSIGQLQVKKVSSPRKQQQMLEHLHSLKKKNDNIQNNIEKAIDVIENKMVNILGRSGTSKSIEAFDEIKKEITNVLSMMKFPASKNMSKRKTPLKREDVYDQETDEISKELFKKLDKILESPGSEEISKVSLTKIKTKKKYQSARPTGEMEQVCFDSTSASGNEKFTITAISPKRITKTSLDMNISPIEPTSSTDEELAKLSTEIRKLRDELILQEVDPQIKIKMTANVENELNMKNLVPPHEQVINLALVTTNNKELCEGDHLEKSQEGSDCSLTNLEPSCSIGEGDTVPTNIQEDVQEIDDGIQLQNENNKMNETSEDFFTPCSSPLDNEREKNQKEIAMSEIESIQDINITESSETSESFYQNVHRIISRVESVYNQLDQFDEETCQQPKIFKEKEIDEVDSDTFLTPFMHAVKDLRNDSKKSSPRAVRSPSYFNVLSFLDNLVDVKEEQHMPIEVHIPR